MNDIRDAYETDHPLYTAAFLAALAAIAYEAKRTTAKHDAFTLCACNRLLTRAAQCDAVTEPRPSGSGCAVIYDAVFNVAR
jgi:hypothetical protein